MKYEFPKDFIWGVATAAAQVEGAAFEDGIPNATMYHWALPYALQVQGGFGNRDIIKWFTYYVGILLDNFGEDVDIWATFNEPIATYVGYFPAREGNIEDEAFVIKSNEIEGYGMFLHPLFFGEYSHELLRYFEENDLMPETEEGDFKTICQKLDFYGLNFYNGLYDNAEDLRQKEKEVKGGNYQERPENHTG